MMTFEQAVDTANLRTSYISPRSVKKDPEEFDRWLAFWILHDLKISFKKKAADPYLMGYAFAVAESFWDESEEPFFLSGELEDRLLFSLSFKMPERIRANNALTRWFSVDLRSGLHTHVFLSEPSGEIMISNEFSEWASRMLDPSPEVKNWFLQLLKNLEVKGI